MPTRHPILDPTSDALEAWLKSRDLPAYRGPQIRKWLFHRRVDCFSQMTDLPVALREALAADFTIYPSKIVRHQQTQDGTEKLLLQLADGHRIECVLIRDAARRTVCVSTQVGCAMGCVFCASGLDGVERNLTAAEIIEQMLLVARLLDEEERLSHLVVMGMGEPLANLDQLLPALAQATQPEGLGISTRRITISTVGLPPAMRRLAAARSGYHLAVSLHAADDALRSQLVPVNQGTGLAEIMQAADEYFERSGRRLTFEYVLLGGVNDRPEHARRLAQLLRGRGALLNVIPYNPVAGLSFQTPTSEAIAEFRDVLLRQNINVQFRVRKGDKIAAACGQLRRSNPAVSVQSLGPIQPKRG